jgi:hypothetical protein
MSWRYCQRKKKNLKIIKKEGNQYGTSNENVVIGGADVWDPLWSDHWHR